ncbi:uncharacterized protein LOC135151512 [Daucus carota subsp. sativus]|uniref:uncharacterized protein LOC135151512 n=1 Tax=Daucus carota subsp. sativus TaxID=79200 RepID=UPI0030836F83
MSTTTFEFNGAKFLTNNYAAILDNDEAPKEFHLIQDVLAHSELMYALTQPESISPSQVVTFWRTANYDDGGDHGSPSLTCEYEGQEYFVSPATIRKALHLPDHHKFDSPVPTQTLRDMMNFFGYSASTDKMGELKRPHLCKEWSFYYDCITRAFGDRRKENMNIVYYARFCQLIFSYCFPAIPIPESGNELPFKITKRAFTDLIKKDSKKPNAPVFVIPVTVQDKLRVAMPDKYGPLFSDENIPQLPSSSAQPDAHPTSGPSQQGPVVKSDQTLTSGPSQKGSVETTSPKRVLRSSKSPSKPSPPPRKRRFLQKISDSDSDEAPPHPPPAKKQRKKIKPTDITDLTVETPQSEDPIQTLIQFSDQPSGAEPVMIEPISAVPLEPLAADIQMSESISACNDQPVVAKSDEVLKLNQESLIQHEDITAADTHVSDKTPDIPSQSEDAHIEVVLQMIQDSLIQTQANVAAPVQEVPIAATSDAATEALASHTLSIFVNDDDDDATEVTSVPIQTSTSPTSDPVRESTPVKIDSPVHTWSPVRESTPTPVHASPIQHPISAQRKVCQLSYFKRMCRVPPPSVEDRLASIEATQTSMQHTLADLSCSVAQLVQVLTSADVKKGEKISKDKCKSDQQMTKRRPDGDEEGNREMADKQLKLLQIKEKERSNNEANSDRPRDSQQKHKSMELTIMSQVQSISEAVRISDDISKELAVVNSEVEKKKKEDLIPESDKLIEAGDPESQKFCQTLKFRGRETTLFYKSPSLQAIDEAVARKIFEKENPGKSMIKIASENPSQRMIKLSKNANIITDVSDQTEEEEAGLTRRRKGEVKLISDITLTSDNAQVKAPVTEEKTEDTKVSWLKINSEKTQDQKKKSLFGSLGTSLYKESSMLTRIRAHGTRGKEAYDTTGLGHRKEKIQTSSATTFRDPYPLTEKVGESVTQKDLDKVESVQILMDTHDGTGDKEKIAIFLEQTKGDSAERGNGKKQGECLESSYLSDWG